MHGPAAIERGNTFFVEASSGCLAKMLQGNELGRCSDVPPVEAPAP